MKYMMPLAEVVTDFYDELKSRSSGYATFDYEDAGYEESDLVKVCALLYSTIILYPKKSVRIVDDGVAES